MLQNTLKPRTFFHHDNLPILRGINSNSIDLIYLDPPFMNQSHFKNHLKDAELQYSIDKKEFKEAWSKLHFDEKWYLEIHEKYPALYKYLDVVELIDSKPMKFYLMFMVVRLIEMRRILKDTGSIYLHCSPNTSHYLKLLMDMIFKNNNFVNEISLCYRGGISLTRSSWGRKHDTLLFYSKSGKRIFNTIRRDIDKDILSRKMRGDGESFKGNPLEDWWTDINFVRVNSKERTGFPTQKPLALLQRIIKASSNEGDMVLDPFCGTGTACIAAEQLNRKWIGVDVSIKAYEFIKLRLEEEKSSDVSTPEAFLEEGVPERTDIFDEQSITEEHREYLFNEQRARCNGCKHRFGIQHFVVDRIIPEGGYSTDNLQLLCYKCNMIKGKRPMKYLELRLRD